MRSWLPQPVVNLLRSVGYGLVAAAILLASLFAVARTWPPVVVVESASMQHSNQTSFVGVVDTGDMVLVQEASDPAAVVTYVEGRTQGHGTYSDYGDAIIFQRPTDARAVIHRPLFRVLWNETAGGFDIPSLLGLKRGVDWDSDRTDPLGLRAGDSVTLYNTSFRGLTVRVRISPFVYEVIATRCVPENPCYVTMGDNNAPNYDSSLVRHSWVLGRARGEIPWLGLLKLVLDGTYGWGDGRVPANSWTFLAVSLVLLLVAPLALEVRRRVLAQRRARPDQADEGGLGGVLSVLEERWRGADGDEGGDSEGAEEESETGGSSSNPEAGSRPR